MSTRYEIDENNVVRIWKNEELGNTQPLFVQPFSPETGQEWASREDAEAWAINQVSASNSSDIETPTEEPEA